MRRPLSVLYALLVASLLLGACADGAEVSSSEVSSSEEPERAATPGTELADDATDPTDDATPRIIAQELPSPGTGASGAPAADASATPGDEPADGADQAEPADRGDEGEGDEDDQDDQDGAEGEDGDEADDEGHDTAPLTGLPFADEGAADRRTLAVKIDNAPGARPQIGLNQADVVVEELVEGGVTRFLALYQSVNPDTIGPVRSGREVDALILPSFTPLVVMSGADQAVKEDFGDVGLTVVEDRETPGWARLPDRPGPHDLFVNAPALWEVAAELPAPEPAWPTGDGPEGGGPASSAALTFPAATAMWRWDGDEGLWRRDQDGAPHVVEPDQQQVTADNVVIARVAVVPGSRTDSSGTPTADIAAVGEGEVTVLRDGTAYTGTWRKPSPQEPYQWLDADGEPLPLKPGCTWIELLPTDAPLEVAP